MHGFSKIEKSIREAECVEGREGEWVGDRERVCVGGWGRGVVGRPLTCCEFKQLKPVSGALEFRVRAEVDANSKVANCPVEAPLSSLWQEDTKGPVQGIVRLLRFDDVISAAGVWHSLPEF